MPAMKHVDTTAHAAASERGSAEPGFVPQPVGMLPVPLIADPGVPLRRLAIGDDPLGGQAPPPAVSDVLRRRAGRGAPLPEPVRSRMGEQFGVDLSGVRVHNDSEAHNAAQAVQSIAFTHGRDIYFSRGSFNPGSGAGQRLLAHELAHATSRERAGGPGSATVGRADDPAEVAADRVADRAMHAIRRTHPFGGPDLRDGATADAGQSELANSGTQALRRWPWSKTQQAEPGAERPDRATFKTMVQGPAPSSPDEAATRMQELRRVIQIMSADERNRVSTDKKLMTQARQFVGAHEYMTLVAALGTYVMPTKKAIKAATKQGENAPVHMSGAEADGFIRRNMGAIPHLKGYIATAVEAGKQADGFVAVVGADDWARVYDQQYASSGKQAGVDDELTNAFIANTHADRPAIIHQDRGTRSTAIHESMHRYSELAILRTYGSPLNEGVTEYFTRLITDKDGNPTNGKPSNRDNYERNWTFVSRLLSMLGNTLVDQQRQLAEIYFSGKVDLLETNFKAACKAANLAARPAARRWSDFVAKLKGGAWADATGLLPPPPAPRQPQPADDGSAGPGAEAPQQSAQQPAVGAARR